MNLITNSVFTAAELEQFRLETAGCRHVIHLNNAGSGLMPDVVTQTVVEHLALESEIGGYEAAAARAAAIREFYTQAAQLLSCQPGNVAFTASATDSYTRALSSIPFQPGDTILTDCDDFVSNQIQFLSLGKRLGTRLVRIANAAGGGVDLQDLERKLFELKPKLLAITHIPTNSGLQQPVHQIGDIYARYRASHPDATWYILDACQSAGQMKLNVQTLACDFLTATNRKFLRGPRGTGLLYVSDRALEEKLEPLFIDMRGATWMEKDFYQQQDSAKRFEDWEFAYATVVGSSEAIRYCLSVGEEKIERQTKLLASYLRSELSRLKNVRVLDRGPELAALVTFHVAGVNVADALKVFAKNRINVTGSYREFAVIDFDEKHVEWAIRASPHYYNTVDELNSFLQVAEMVASGRV